MDQVALQAVQEVLQQWIAVFMPTLSDDLKPVAASTAWDAIAAPKQPDFPAPETITAFNLPHDQWTYTLFKTADPTRFVASFSQPLRDNPVATSTAQIELTYLKAGEIQVQLEGQSRVYVLFRSETGKWGREHQGSMINISKWGTELIRSKRMIHDGRYASIYSAVFGKTSVA